MGICMLITIIGNNKNELDILKKNIISWSIKSDADVETKAYTSGEEYFSKNSSNHDKSTAFFLDAQMDGMSGIDVARRLRAEKFKGFIVFVSAFEEYAIKGYDVRALKYLLKPIDESLLTACLDGIISELKTNSYMFKARFETVIVPYSNIIAFSSNSSHSIDILTDSERYSQYSSLNKILSSLPKEFVRVHRGHIINMAHIRKITSSAITLSNKMTVQVGRNYLSDFEKAFSDYSLRFEM